MSAAHRTIAIRPARALSRRPPEEQEGHEGYPLLLQTGETADGRTPLVDRQHPHDLFMELAGSYSVDLGKDSSAFLSRGYNDVMARAALPIPPPGFDDLSVQEKLDYVQSLWDRIFAQPEDVPIPEWHLQLLDERLAEYDSDPEAGSSWEEVREEILLKIRERAESR